jgi:flagellin
MSSINTNLSAMTALQALKATQTAMNKNQNQISTGLRVGSAADNASYWAISTKMKSDNGALGSVKDSLKQSVSMIDTFSKANDNTLSYLNKIKTSLTSAMQPGANLDKINTEIAANIAGLKSAGESASINGQNWLTDGSTVKMVASYNGQSGQVGTIDVDTSSMKLFTTDSSGKFASASGTDILANIVNIGLNSAAPTYGNWGEYSAKTDASGSLTSAQIGALAQKMVEGGNKVVGTDASAYAAPTGDSTFKIKVGNAETTITIATTDATLDDVATAITSAMGGKLTASVDTATNGLVLTAGAGYEALDITIGGDDAFGATSLDLSTIGLTAGTTLGGSTGADPAVQAPDATHDKVTVDTNGTVTVEHQIGAGESGTVGDLKKTTFEKDAGGNWTMSTQTAKTSTAGTSLTALQGFLDNVNAAIEKVTTASAVLGANKSLLEAQGDFISALSDSLTAGVSAYVDADMNEVSTRNQALQTQQQLGVQALSMANQNSQMILKLFQ